MKWNNKWIETAWVSLYSLRCCFRPFFAILFRSLLFCFFRCYFIPFRCDFVSFEAILFPFVAILFLSLWFCSFRVTFVPLVAIFNVVPFVAILFLSLHFVISSSLNICGLDISFTGYDVAFFLVFDVNISRVVSFRFGFFAFVVILFLSLSLYSIRRYFQFDSPVGGEWV
jgi:hypothetical protein